MRAKVTTTYVCEICGKEYNTESLAIQCEKFHKCSFETTHVKFEPRDKDKTGLPISITIKTKEDKPLVATYERKTVYKENEINGDLIFEGK